tara:strand:+ start:1572 stop:2564 length:993 start_codon:yes stop_codon:yes gene_type:complete
MSSKLNDALAKLNKNFGSGSVFHLGENEAFEKLERISTGSLGLDVITGGGYPLGRIIELFGWESSGKSTLCVHAIAEAQAMGKRCAFVDMEHAFDKNYAEALGVDTEELIFCQPSSGEEAIEITKTLADTGEVGLVVVDSVATMVPSVESEGEAGESKMGVHARLMSQAMRVLSPIASRNNCTLIFVNQLRQKIGVMYGSPDVTTGGNALKFYSSIRIKLTSSKSAGNKEKVDGVDRQVSNLITATTEKNKTYPPLQKHSFQLRFGIGIDAKEEIVDMAIALGLIDKKGAWYSYDGTQLGQGKKAVFALLDENPDLEETLRDEIIKHYNK